MSYNNLHTTHVNTSKKNENKNNHRLWSVFGVTPHLNYFLLCHYQHIDIALYQYNPCHSTEQVMYDVVFVW